jgi:hypothetical protein
MSAPRLAPIKQAVLVAPRPVQDTPWSTDFCPANNIVRFNANLTTTLLNYQDSNTPFEKKYLFLQNLTRF